jgi:hypothetical protein
MLLELLVVVLLSRVVVAALTATLASRRGQELGGLLMAVVIALVSGGWSLATIVGQQLAAGPPAALSTALRVLPRAGGRSRWRPPTGRTGRCWPRHWVAWPCCQGCSC